MAAAVTIKPGSRPPRYRFMPLSAPAGTSLRRVGLFALLAGIATTAPALSPLTPEARARAQAAASDSTPLQPPPQPPELLPEQSRAAVRAPVKLPAAQTIADQRLQRIYDSQLEFFAELARNPEMADTIRDQRVQNLLNRYQSLLLDNPEYVYGYILYGKLLRQVGQRELANMAFTKANGLNPNIAVVKQQIANYLSENGNYDLALPYYLAAIQLEPEVALYHYQMGELLHTFRESFTTGGELDAATLDRQMQSAFANAARLEPQTRIYPQRYAESFFDVAEPDWQQALPLWEALEQSAADALQQQIARLQKARVWLALGKRDAAAQALAGITEPALQEAAAVLQQQLATPTSAAPASPAPSTGSAGKVENGNR